MFKNFSIASCVGLCVLLSSTAHAQEQEKSHTGMSATTTIPSVGHRPSEPHSELYGINPTTGYTSAPILTTMFPGWRTSKGAGYYQYDPDVRLYNGKENFITTCTFYFVDKANNVAENLTINKTQCGKDDFRINIEKKHVGFKIRLIMVNKTDPKSVADYMPVPLSSIQGKAFETGYISNTPSKDKTIIDIDKDELSPGESATITIVFRDIDGNPLEDMGSLRSGVILQGWRSENMEPTGEPGKYSAKVTYTGGSGANTFKPTWSYFGEILHGEIVLRGVL